jgi:ABC-type multidrug transport system ATPase subunit
MTHGKPAILAEGLEKSYGKTRALAGLNLEVEEGTVLGLLGPNGAGKTTAVRILTTLLRPDAGRAEVSGLNVVGQADELRSRMRGLLVDSSRSGVDQYEDRDIWGYGQSRSAPRRSSAPKRR